MCFPVYSKCARARLVSLRKRGWAKSRPAQPLATAMVYTVEKKFVISISHLLSEFQVSEFIECIDSQFCEQIG